MDVFIDVSERVFNKQAKKLGLGVNVLKAVAIVESMGHGFLDYTPIKPKILFEGHVFYRLLTKAGYDTVEIAKRYPTICFKAYTRSHYRGGNEEFIRLKTAMTIDYDIALESASWGMFQIMGFNYALCGFKDVKTYVNSNYNGADNHFMNFCAFIKNRGLIKFLKDKDFSKFARYYNGVGYKSNKYDDKMRDAYESLEAG